MGYRLEYFLLLIPYAPHQIHIKGRMGVLDIPFEILTKKMSQENALRWINKWSRESPSCRCAK